MPRVIKHPDIRREELLAIAAERFAAHGYERTSVDDIIRAAGLSKGAFYYYYPSKDALLVALAAQVAERALVRMGDVLEAPGLNAVERLNAFLRGGQEGGGEDRDVAIFGGIFRPENLTLYHRLHAAVTGVMLEPMTRIVEQGINEGMFRSSQPGVTAEILLLLGAVTHDSVAGLLSASTEAERRHAFKAFEQRLAAQGIAMDRILGLEDGTILPVDPESARQLYGFTPTGSF